MAAEVKKRMDEAQRDLERSAVHREDEDDEEEEDEHHHLRGSETTPSPAIVGGISSWGAGAYGADPERRSVREADRDLLEGAEVVSVRGKDEASLLDSDDKQEEQGAKAEKTESHAQGSNGGSPKGSESPSAEHGTVVSKVVEFES